MTQYDHTGSDPLDREFAPGWIEQAGDKIRGQLRGIDTRDAGYGPYPIYTFEPADGYPARTRDGFVSDAVAVHVTRDVLRRKLENAKLAIGDEVGIKYLGPPRSGAKSHRYRVIKWRPDGSWVESTYDDEDGPDEDGHEEEKAVLATERLAADESKGVDDYGTQILY